MVQLVNKITKLPHTQKNLFEHIIDFIVCTRGSVATEYAIVISILFALLVPAIISFNSGMGDTFDCIAQAFSEEQNKTVCNSENVKSDGTLALKADKQVLIELDQNTVKTPNYSLK